MNEMQGENAIRQIRIEDYNYPLPDERIARYPLEERDACRLLIRAHDGTIADATFRDLPEHLPEGAMLVYNNTRVINARLRFRKATTTEGPGALIEIFCLDPVEPHDYALNFAQTGKCSWACMVGNSKKWKDGPLSMTLDIDGKPTVLTATRTARTGNSSVVTFEWDNPEVTFSSIIEHAGVIPIPPYLNRETEKSDSHDYQTVYSRIDGSVAAPTAGLHFTPSVLDAIDRRGIERHELTLHVGAGTFQPVKSDVIGDHPMHSEFIEVDLSLIKRLARQLESGRKVIAVGTTSVRTLESLYHIGCMTAAGTWDGELPQWAPYSGTYPLLPPADALNSLARHLEREGAERLTASTRIIIAPGYDYKVVGGMVTNFHQPQSTLLLLVSAFTGGDWQKMYDHALKEGYRFLSYGDASLLL